MCERTSKENKCCSFKAHKMGVRTLVVLAVVVGTFLRFAWYFYAQPYPTSSDSGIYFELTKTLLNFGQYAEYKSGVLIPYAYFLPGYSWYLSAFMFFSQSFLIVALANIVASVSIIPVVYLLVDKLLKEKGTAVIAAWLCALQPSFIVYGSAVQSENLFSALFYGGLFVLIMRSRITVLRTIIASLLFAWACLVRGEGLFYMPCVFLGGLFLNYAEGTHLICKKNLSLFLMPFVIVMVLGLWMVRNYQVVGVPTLSTTSGLNFYLAHNNKGYGWQDYSDLVDFLDNGRAENGEAIQYASVESSAFFMKHALLHLKENPTAIFKDIMQGTLHLYRPSTSVLNSKDFPVVAAVKFVAWILVCVLAAASVFYWRNYHRKAVYILLSVVAMNWVCYAVLFWSSPRYRFAIEVIVIMFASITISNLYEKFRAKPLLISRTKQGS